ncbi:MAG TPA: thiol:disulfide interchange protein DsbA/DsbL [Lamprocystis sp. (in: g-proteobacteria)]|nr:thiol:disulfide interchange protein DsbA/DsbL [Lamprocystis sp. (in: g-proteobacteria)]
MSRALRMTVLFGLVLAALASAAPGWAIDEGIDYATLKTPIPAAVGSPVEVVEVFWYGCPHCWHLEPAMQQWVATKPAGVTFTRMPATGARWEPHARAYYAAEAMGKLDLLHEALFKAMQVDKRRIYTADDLVKFAGEIGINEQEFRAAYNSFTVETKVRKAEDLNRRFGIDGVPAAIVNGKYRTSPGQTGGQDRFFEVLNTLVTQELAANGTNRSATPASAAAPSPTSEAAPSY